MFDSESSSSVTVSYSIIFITKAQPWKSGAADGHGNELPLEGQHWFPALANATGQSVVTRRTTGDMP